ncbi:unnamed protein product [Strongylus vulgaris]|uniref:Uncharacterized protein n=1 Tax=Strongylus vulgaris TaxID=40348 RepID=A0A3P7L0L2_STRVU|nr:unnamed protein product [Strongylus vulgaris]
MKKKKEEIVLLNSRKLLREERLLSPSQWTFWDEQRRQYVKILLRKAMAYPSGGLLKELCLRFISLRRIPPLLLSYVTTHHS